MKLKDAIEAYLIASKVEGKTAQTLRGISWELGQFLLWKEDVSLDSIGAAQLREYLSFHQDRGLSDYSIHDKFKVLRAFFRWCLREELLARDPTASVARPRLPQLLPKVLTREQVISLVQRLQEDRSPVGVRNLTMIRLLLDCGFRASELTNLCVEDVHLEESYIVVAHGKGQKQRLVPMSPTARRHLSSYMEKYREQFKPRDSSLFIGKEGKALQLIAVQHAVRKSLGMVGIKGGPHLLRHTFATFYLRNGGDLERLRLVLGHADLSVIQRYVHLLSEDLVKRHQEISPLTMLGL